MKKPGIKKKFTHDEVVSVRFEKSEYDRVREIAALETVVRKRVISAQDLIREAVSFVFNHNEKLRECFRRSRILNVRKYNRS